MQTGVVTMKTRGYWGCVGIGKVYAELCCWCCESHMQVKLFYLVTYDLFEVGLCSLYRYLPTSILFNFYVEVEGFLRS